MPGDQPRMTFDNTGSVIGVQGESRGPVTIHGASSPLPTGIPLPLDRLLGALREELRAARNREELDPDSYADAEGLVARAAEADVQARTAGVEETDAAGARATIVRSLRQLRGLAEGVTGVLAAIGAALAAVQGIR